MSNEHIDKAERQLELAQRMLHEEYDKSNAVQRHALMSVAESLLSIAKSFRRMEEEAESLAEEQSELLGQREVSHE